MDDGGAVVVVVLLLLLMMMLLMLMLMLVQMLGTAPRKKMLQEDAHSILLGRFSPRTMTS